MSATATAVEGTPLLIAVPDGWRILSAQGSLLAVDERPGRFSPNLSVLFSDQQVAVRDVVRLVLDALVAPILIDAQQQADSLDLMFCHLTGSVSATARQRHVPVPGGVAVITTTSSTSGWTAFAPVSQQILDSLEVQP